MTAPSQVVGRVKSKTTTASVLPSTSPPTTLEDKGKGNPRQQQQNTHVKLKVVVRGLPPNLPESLFKDTTKEWINETTVDWYYYVAGKLYERGNKPNVRSRAYAKFKTVDALITFHKAFNGHTFTDSKGRSSRAMIEFAPFQKFVKGKTKVDTRQGTIDTSPEYKEFLDSLNQPAPPSTDPVTADEEVKTTPLIEFIRTQKAARAEKERINREKVRLAKIAALQAKANAQTAKLRAEKMQKVEAAAATNKVGESSKPSGSATRGGRGGGKSSGKGKDVQRAKAQQQQKHQQQSRQEQKAKEGTAIVLVGEGSTTEIPVNPVPPQSASPAETAAVLNIANGGGNSGAPGLRGGRGRGRARPHGIYRGRGGRRGGASNEGKSPTSVAEA